MKNHIARTIEARDNATTTERDLKVFNLNIEYTGAALNRDNARESIAAMLQAAAQGLLDDADGGVMLDRNGNKAGEWEYTPEPWTVFIDGQRYSVSRPAVGLMELEAHHLARAAMNAAGEPSTGGYEGRNRLDYVITREDDHSLAFMLEQDGDNITGFSYSLYDPEGEELHGDGIEFDPQDSEAHLQGFAERMAAWIDGENI